MIAALTGITTVGDFRPGDIAIGGQGAPLAPYCDYMLRRSERANRVILNIGGISNLTYLPKSGSREDVIAFDAGPGNMVSDALFQVLFPGEGNYDEDGVRASAGTPSEEICEQLMRHPFFAAAPPARPATANWPRSRGRSSRPPTRADSRRKTHWRRRSCSRSAPSMTRSVVSCPRGASRRYS
jgi:1,6-anhydro-N-acetylmuramate kinase